MSINKKIITLIKEKKMKLAIAESCTGGMLSSAITSVSGSSKVFTLGLVTYSNQAKTSILKVSQKIINNYREHEQDKVMLKVIEDTKQQVYDMYDNAVEEEKRWATYLLTKGSMIGLSEKLLHRFVEHMANKRMRTIGLEAKYDQKTNPLPWVSHWLNSKGLQNAPQETEIESYVIGGIKQDVEKDQFKEFKL